MIPSILCYVPLSVELLVPTTAPDFKPGPTTTPCFQTKLTPLSQAFMNRISQWSFFARGPLASILS